MIFQSFFIKLQKTEAIFENLFKKELEWECKQVIIFHYFKQVASKYLRSLKIVKSSTI